MIRARWCRSVDDAAARFGSLFGSAGALGVRAALAEAEVARMTAAVIARRDAWTSDFGGEQFALGRAFYTHLETGAASRYFEEAGSSDAIVEAVVPGMQRATLALLGMLLGAAVRRRNGFAGPGIHVFPAAEKVAREGGVVHFDLEGLTEHHLETGARAVTLVVMLQPPSTGGGLKLWEVVHDGTPDTELELDAIVGGSVPSTIARSGPGDALLIDSRRLHQIQPFGGARDRISITVHAVEIDRGRCWEAWF